MPSATGTTTLVPETLTFEQTQAVEEKELSLDPEVLPKLAPEFVDYFTKVLSKKRPTHTVPIDQVRADPHRWASPWIPKDDEITKRTEEHDVGTTDGSAIKVRVYYPDPVIAGPGPYAVHINYHGGGFVFGDLSSDAPFCSTVRSRLPIVVVDVQYRLCPDVVYGQNIKDAWTAFLWVRENASTLKVNISSVSLGGISAGAHFTCVLQHMARDAGIKLRLAIPAVPPTADHTLYNQASDSPWPSFTEYRNAPMLNWDRITYFQQYAFPRDSLADLKASVPDWWISPLLAKNFKGICDTFMITAECDPLRDEGEGYAMLLIKAGVKVTMKRYPGVPHPFMHMTCPLPQAREYNDDVISALKAAHQL